MFRKLFSPHLRGAALATAGMGALFAGRKLSALALFGKGALELERNWRDAHPEFDGDLSERWAIAAEFYEATHQHPTNRKLHIVGIPMILGGAAGLLIFRPYRPLWLGAAGSFGLGWVLNIVGHAAYEKNAPAFAEDPLAFIAGPIWDLSQLRRKSAAAPAPVVDLRPEPEAAQTLH